MTPLAAAAPSPTADRASAPTRQRIAITAVLTAMALVVLDAGIARDGLGEHITIFPGQTDDPSRLNWSA
jgi:hypothetical protein